VRDVRLDHVAVAVRDLEAALKALEGLGLRCTHVEEVSSEHVRTAFLPAGDAAVELLQPTSQEGAVARFLASREGVHHVAFRVADLEDALRKATRAGLVVIPPAPRPGARNSWVAFLHPKSTFGVLIELVERP